MRVTLVLGLLRVVRVVVVSSSSLVRGVRVVREVDESEVLVGVRSGLMSLVTGGLVLVIVPVVVVVVVLVAVPVDEKAGSTKFSGPGLGASSRTK